MVRSPCGRFGRHAIALSIAAVVSGSPSPGQEHPPAPALAQKVADLRVERTFRARGRLVHTNAAKQRKVYQISVLQKRLAHGTNLLWSVTDPPEAKMRLLVEMQPGGKTTVWVASGETRTGASTLPRKRWAEPILGSHLTVEDLAEEYFSWPAQSLNPDEETGGRMCYVLRSDSGGEHPTAYQSVLTWIDQTTRLPLKVRKIPSGSGPWKEIVSAGLRLSGGQWVTSSAEFRINGSPGSTRIVFTGGAPNARVRDSEVDPNEVFGAGVARHPAAVE